MAKIVQPTGDVNFTRLAELLEAEAGLGPGKGADVLHAVLNLIGRHVVAGYRVKLTNFGSFFPIIRRLPDGGLPAVRAAGWEIPNAVRKVRFTATGLFDEAVRTGDPVVTLRKRGKGKVSGA